MATALSLTHSSVQGCIFYITTIFADEFNVFSNTLNGTTVKLCANIYSIINTIRVVRITYFLTN